jgi:Fe-S-cluster containining protein
LNSGVKLKFSCICCGTCCKKYQPCLTSEEVDKISGQLGLTRSDFLANYTDHRWPGTNTFLLIHVNQACVFLKASKESQLNLCRIHDYKPVCCQEWVAGLNKPECQAGLKQQFGISIDPYGQLVASREQEQFLENRLAAIAGL